MVSTNPVKETMKGDCCQVVPVEGRACVMFTLNKPSVIDSCFQKLFKIPFPQRLNTLHAEEHQVSNGRKEEQSLVHITLPWSLL